MQDCTPGSRAATRTAKAIALTRLQELVTELYLAETEAKAKKLWQQVEKALDKMKLKPTVKKHILEKQDVQILAENLNGWLRSS